MFNVQADVEGDVETMTCTSSRKANGKTSLQCIAMHYSEHAQGIY